MTSNDTGNEMLEEDTNIPNYDAEMDSIWEKVDDFIKSISGSNNDSATMIAML
jgi:replication-associated recombination protein RarA